jgi:hypothetical protein
MTSAYIFLFIIHLIVLAPLIYMWVNGIDYMQKNHPNYKGKDLFGEDVDTK